MRPRLGDLRRQRWIRWIIYLCLAYFIGRLARLTVILFLLAVSIFGPVYDRYKIHNARGDVLEVKTNVVDGPPYTTEVTVHRAWDFDTRTLIQIKSWTYWVDLRWEDDDHALISYDYEVGCTSEPRASVGPFTIDYIRFPNHPPRPAHGILTHESIPEDAQEPHCDAGVDEID